MESTPDYLLTTEPPSLMKFASYALVEKMKDCAGQNFIFDLLQHTF